MVFMSTNNSILLQAEPNKILRSSFGVGLDVHVVEVMGCHEV